MSTIKALVPYQIETFRARPVGAGAPIGDREAETPPASNRRENTARFARPARSTPFLVQLMVHAEQDLRKNLGRTEIAHARENAYGAALAKRPSAGGLRFLHAIGKA
jgi:hypothetical protein